MIVLDVVLLVLLHLTLAWFTFMCLDDIRPEQRQLTKYAWVRILMVICGSATIVISIIALILTVLYDIAFNRDNKRARPKHFFEPTPAKQSHN